MARQSKPRRAPPPEPGPEAGPTFAEVLERTGLMPTLGQATRDIIANVNAAAVEHVRVHLKVVSCYACTVPACCSYQVSAYLYEAVAIAARLIREGRDTPELRAALTASAHAMETTPKARYRQPCELLDGAGRCSVYDDRPSVCGTLLVSSPAEVCADPLAPSIEVITGPMLRAAQPELEEQFYLSMGLRRIPVLYRGALPRMVLLALQAWHRRDYVAFLADRALPASHRFEAASK